MGTFPPFRILRLSLALCCIAPPLAAAVEIAPLFGDGAVLQRGMEVPVWGTAGAGEEVTVRFNGKQVTTTADRAGRWSLKLPSMEAGGPFDLAVAGNKTVVVRDVAVGEVWIASGQSNMQFPLRTSTPEDPIHGPPARKAVAAANDPLLRMYTVAPKLSPDTPVDNADGPAGTWKATTPGNAEWFSAVAYYYARELRRELGVPVGIIHTTWGGTPIQAWISQSVFEALPPSKPILEEWSKIIADHPAKQKKFEEEILPAWQREVETARLQGLPKPKKIYPPQGPNSPARPSTLFNGMVHPLIPYAIRGVIWYQGEADANNAANYKLFFPAMIRDWRARWGQGEFPFLYVQLANFRALQRKPVEKGWAFLREAQLMTLAIPNTGMAVAIDLADKEKPEDIHPHNKSEVGRRLSLLALAKVYDRNLPSHSGPLYVAMETVGNKARLRFAHADGGLVALDGPLRGFAIAGKDGNFVWGEAKIEGDTVVVSSDEVPEPAAVRYGWASNPIGNLYNKEGLPASPFRTDIDAPK